MSKTVRVFVNGEGLDVPSGGTALDAIEASSVAAANDVRNGALIVTDSRGLPLNATSTVFNGALYRLVPPPKRRPEVAHPSTRSGA